MANFTCDICGGNIKMQGSQGGVCQNCGMEYDLEAIRAKVNAAPQPKIETPVVVEPTPKREQQSQEDRDALIIYLNDLRTMETIIYEDYERKKTIRKKEQDYKSELISIDNELSKAEKYHNPVKPDATGILVAFFVMIIIAGSTLALISAAYAMIICAILVPVLLIIPYVNYSKRNREYTEAVLRKYNTTELINQRKSSKSAEYDKWKADADVIKTELEDDMDSIKVLLRDAYSANIIPLQFRNIEGVYYLYDYLSTSNQSLAEALMQANLEAIKQKIEQMIQIQGKMLIEQQQTNARLENIQQTNQNILKTAALTARYAQVAAVNSELAVKLSSKQLAYQRADFWLK